MFLILCCALHKFLVIEGRNMHDQISSDERSKRMMRLCSMHSIFLSVKVQICAGHIYLPCMLDSNMEIRIVGSYGCLQ